MQINLSELFSIDGKERSYTPDIETNSFHTPVGVYEIVDKNPVTIRIRNLGDRKLHLEGRAIFSLGIPCARCLDPVVVPFDFEFEQGVDMKQTEEERLASLNEQPYIRGYYLDVDQLLSNELLLSIPMKVLCSNDCQGICNRCGVNLNHRSCTCDRSSPDPRMSVVQDLFQKFKEV